MPPIILLTSAAIRVMNRTKVNYFEPGTIKQILEAFDEESFDRRVLGYTLVYTGARRGEILGLEWHNVDLDKETVSIEITYSTTQKKACIWTPLKRKRHRGLSAFPVFWSNSSKNTKLSSTIKRKPSPEKHGPTTTLCS